MTDVSTTQTEEPSVSGVASLRRKAEIDYATLIGVLGAFFVITLAMILGGSPGSFIDIPAILIVFGGTFLITTVSFSLSEVVQAQTVMLRSVIYHAETPANAALHVLYLASIARKSGTLSLENELDSSRQSGFFYRSISMAVDGVPAEEIETTLASELEAIQIRHDRSTGVLRRAGEVAPAMGLIGTLIGLVQMLGNLDNPSLIGPAMAVALLTTFYGAILANMVFLPVANKLERNSHVEALVNRIYAIGSASISRQENPRRLEMTINTILPPAARVSFFD